MRKSHVDTASHAMVAGWAADTDRPDEVLAIRIFVDGEPAATFPANQKRADLAKRGGFGDGRHGFRFSFDPPLRREAAHRIRVCYADSDAALTNGERMLPAEPPAQADTGQPPPAVSPNPALIPILVTGSARSGTTLLMSLLAGGPEIIAAELAPFEVRLLAYYANAHNVLTHEADTVRSTHQNNVKGDGYFIGFNPYNNERHANAFTTPAIAADYAEHYVPRHLHAGFADLITEYYHRLARDKDKAGARFFAEKNNTIQPLVSRFTRHAFRDVREVITIRDPRDVMGSYLSYFKHDAERAFAEITNATRIILDLHAQTPRDVYFSPYERLVRGEKASLRALSDFLQTEIAQPPAALTQEIFSMHGTSADAGATIARWRTDLPTAWQDRCNAGWRSFLETFGYSDR
jgi:hypothetical protein